MGRNRKQKSYKNWMIWKKRRNAKYKHIRKSVQSFIQQVWEYYESKFGTIIDLKLFESDNVLKECVQIIKGYSFNIESVFNEWNNIPERRWCHYMIFDKDNSWKPITIKINDIASKDIAIEDNGNYDNNNNNNNDTKLVLLPRKRSLKEVNVNPIPQPQCHTLKLQKVVRINEIFIKDYFKKLNIFQDFQHTNHH